MGVYSQLKSCHYCNACACALYSLLLSVSQSKNLGNTNDSLFLAFGRVENGMTSDYISLLKKIVEYNCCVFYQYMIHELQYDNLHIVPRHNSRIPYQPSTFISALGSSALGLMRDSRDNIGISG